MSKLFNPFVNDADQQFVARQLEYVRAKTADILFPPLKFRELVPINYEAPTGMADWNYRSFEKLGQARFIDDYSTDLPNSTVRQFEFKVPFHSIGTSIRYTWQDMAAAQAAVSNGATFNLDVKRMEAARRSIEEKLDSIARTGDPTRGISGLTNLSSVGILTASAAWSSLIGSPSTILADMNLAVNTIVNNTQETFIPDTLVLPTAQYNLIATLPMVVSSGAPFSTVLRFFLDNQPYVKDVIPWIAFKGAGTNGVDRMLAYKRDAMELEMPISLDFTMLPTEIESLEYRIPCIARTCGVVAMYPIGMLYTDGI